MSKLAAPTEDVITHDAASHRFLMKPTSINIRQLVSGHRYFNIASNEEPSAKPESFSFRDSPSRGTSYEDRERLELFRFHDNRSSNVFEMSIFVDNGGYERFYVELGPRFELIGFNDNRGYMYTDASELSDIQDSDSSNDYMESCAFPPLILLCDTAGKLSISGKQR